MLCGQLQRVVTAATRRNEPRRQWFPIVCSNAETGGSGKRRGKPSGAHRRYSRWAYGAALGLGSVGWAFAQLSGVGHLAGYRSFVSASTDFDHIETDTTSCTETQSKPSSNGNKTPSDGGQMSKLVLISGAACYPHPDKIAKGGEDAYFISDDGLSVGVADGVGGWALSGVDAGEYARLLMKTAKEAAENAEDEDESRIPKQVLTKAHGQTTVPGTPPIVKHACKCTLGSSTACILRLDREGSCLHASNLGDSGFFILRHSKIIFKSPPQQYQFNFPYQIGYDTSLNNTPDQAEDFCVRVQPGDIIVTGTDGLWDNVFVEECAQMVIKCRSDGLTPGECSQRVARLAQERSLSLNSRTPFLVGARENGYTYNGGGKPDDVTVVVSYVSQGKSKL